MRSSACLLQRRQDRGIALGVGEAEIAPLARVEDHRADQGVALQPQLDVRPYDQDLVAPDIGPAEAAALARPRVPAGIVGLQVEPDLDLDRAVHAFDRAQHLAHRPQRAGAVVDRHEVEQAHAAAVGREVGLQHGRALDVAPAGGEEGVARPEREAAAAHRIEQAREDRRAGEVGQAQPVDRARARDEGCRPAIADQGVVCDRAQVVRRGSRYGTSCSSDTPT